MITRGYVTETLTLRWSRFKVFRGRRIPETCMYVLGIITLPLLRYIRRNILDPYQDLSRYLQRVGTKSAYCVGHGATPIQTRYGRNAVNTHSGATTLRSHNTRKCITPSTSKLLVCQRNKYNHTNCEFFVPLPLWLLFWWKPLTGIVHLYISWVIPVRGSRFCRKEENNFYINRFSRPNLL